MAEPTLDDQIEAVRYAIEQLIYRKHIPTLRAVLTKLEAEKAILPVKWQLGMPRCDFCDNGLDADWAYCPYCSHVIDQEKAAERKLNKIKE